MFNSIFRKRFWFETMYTCTVESLIIYWIDIFYDLLILSHVGSILPYPNQGGILALEIILLFLLAALESLRVFFGEWSYFVVILIKIIRSTIRNLKIQQLPKLLSATKFWTIACQNILWLKFQSFSMFGPCFLYDFFRFHWLRFMHIFVNLTWLH